MITTGHTSGHSTAPADTRVERRRLRVAGVVQGVGFRPFAHQLATRFGLSGLVGNDAAGVFVEVEGHPDLLDAFALALVDERPPLARVDEIVAEAVAPRYEPGFVIVGSSAGESRSALVPPDVATCDDCLHEVMEPGDRRHRYPFTNCTNCGPRFTIIRDLPYDRPATTMAGFEMCAACADEYADPADRRYHAQPIACPDCGPRLAFELPGAPDPVTVGTDEVLARVQRSLARGEIVAIKGLGGYHLACDAGDDEAVRRLRSRKQRAAKPFAVMVPDLDVARDAADVEPIEAEVLASRARPIVLVRRAVGSAVSPLVAPDNPLLGIMLPYTPLHHLLFRPVPGADVDPPRAIVLTSGNRSNEPICYDDTDARVRLADLADALCTHDRPIEVPCDDSVVRVVDGRVQPIRRSRGYAPIPVELSIDVPPLVATGGELKNTCCVASGRRAWVGQHIGDMENVETLAAFEASVSAFCRMYGVEPIAYAVDEHPEYQTRRWALARHRDGRVDHSVEVQHHHAHVAAVMAEHGLDGGEPVLGVAFDGTGYGHAPDGTVQIWGGEVLLADFVGFRRVAHLAPMPLPGGDAGVRNPCRIAVAWLTALGRSLDGDIPSVAACDDVELGVVVRQVERGVGIVPTTSMGRLFDVVSSLLGVRHRIDYEAQAAIELELLAESGRPGACTLVFGLEHADAEHEHGHEHGADVIDPRPVIDGVVDGLRAGGEPADLALAFHVAVADVVARVAERHAEGRAVALSGGVFQNALLARLAGERLRGFDVLTHRLVPPNDGGLSLGQAVVAAARLREAGRKGVNHVPRSTRSDS